MFAQILLYDEGLEAVSGIVSKIVNGVVYFWIALGIVAMVLILAFAILSWNKGKGS